jgi:hypothetical protein
MPKVKRVEKQIWDIEGFDVRILHLDGRDVRGDRQGIPSWPYERAARNQSTVSAWRDDRFSLTYPGFAVEVLDGNGDPAHGSMNLGKVRDTYED